MKLNEMIIREMGRADKVSPSTVPARVISMGEFLKDHLEHLVEDEETGLVERRKLPWRVIV